MAKPTGWGGPWWKETVRANVPSDPFLMTGFDEKTLAVTHEADRAIRFRVEVDITQPHGNARIPLPQESGDANYTAIRTIEFEIEIVGATRFEMHGFVVDGYVEDEDLNP